MCEHTLPSQLSIRRMERRFVRMQIWRLGVASLLIVHAACQHVGTWAIAERIKPDGGRGLKGKFLEVAQYNHHTCRAFLQTMSCIDQHTCRGFSQTSVDHMPIDQEQSSLGYSKPQQ